MSGKKDKHNLGYKQAANVERRTWDVAKYEARAKGKEKESSESDEISSKAKASKHPALSSIANDEEDDKEEFQEADKNRAKPMFSERAFLKARSGKVDLESKLHTREIISVEDAVVGKKGSDGVSKRAGGAGWYCKVCDCILKDSLAYLDHINGRKHQRALGYSMRIEKSSVSDVKEKLEKLKRKRDEEQVNYLSARDLPVRDEKEELEDEMKKKDEDIARRRAERRRKKKQARRVVEPEVEEEAGIDPQMAAMMGFSGFGGK